MNGTFTVSIKKMFSFGDFQRDRSPESLGQHLVSPFLRIPKFFDSYSLILPGETPNRKPAPPGRFSIVGSSVSASCLTSFGDCFKRRYT